MTATRSDNTKIAASRINNNIVPKANIPIANITFMVQEICLALSGLDHFFLRTQGVALGCHVFALSERRI